MQRRATRMVAMLAAATAIWLASVATPAFGASVLSDGTVTPTEGTTATQFTFTVRYASDDRPNRPAQSVWAQVGDVTVMLAKVSGTSHDGTWQGITTLPAGHLAVSFHATTSGDEQPAPILGPSVTVTEPPPPPPPPPPAPPSTAPPPAGPPSTTTLPPAPPPTAASAPLAHQPAPSPSQPAGQAPASAATPGPADEAPASAANDVSSARPTSGVSTVLRNSDSDVATEPPEPRDTAGTNTGPRAGSLVVALLIVGGAMSIGGAAVLARQWLVSRPRAR